jgi:hypothetical protein
VVVLGLELTAQGCAEHGARSSDASGGEGTTSSTGGGGATTTLSSAATTTGTGGASTTSTASDGVVLPVPATTGGAGAPAGPEALPCPASQWSCTDPVCRRPTYGDATDCSCDYERPKHEDDCAADENFVCNQYATDDGAWTVDVRMKIRFSGVRGDVVARKIDGTSELLVPIRFRRGRAEFEQEIVW